jgi:phage-related protein
MIKRFEIMFLDEAINFIENLDKKTRKKIFYNIDKARYLNDSKLFKKLEDGIWYFRTKHASLHYRIFAFWDKSDSKQTLVIATHGVIKKSNKVLKSEIEKVKRIRNEYFDK